VQHPLSAVLASQERSASWLGRKCGKSPAYISRVISGERRPSADFRRRAAEALGVPEVILFPASEPEAA
jgi:transcriptional regulator with XRE-family HTH domain